MKLQFNPALSYGKSNKNGLQGPTQPCSPGKFSGGLSRSQVTQHSVYSNNAAKFSGGMGPAVVFNPKALQPQPNANRPQGYAQQLLNYPNVYQQPLAQQPALPSNQKYAPLLYIVV